MMERSEYLNMTAEVFEIWPNKIWTERMIAKWWPYFQELPIDAGVKAIDRLLREGHGPFTPDPGLLLRYTRAATPGGANYAVGEYAQDLQEMAESAAPPERASAAISACLQAVADGRARRVAQTPENGDEGP